MTAPQDRELDVATVRVCAAVVQRYIDIARREPGMGESYGAFVRARDAIEALVPAPKGESPDVCESCEGRGIQTTSGDACGMCGGSGEWKPCPERYCELQANHGAAHRWTALRPAPAVEKPERAQHACEFGIFPCPQCQPRAPSDIGPEMLREHLDGLRSQPAPSAPERERVCAVCGIKGGAYVKLDRGASVLCLSCAVAGKRPAAPASSKGEKPMSEIVDDHIIRELGAAFLGIPVEAQPPFSECGDEKAAGWRRVLAKARAVLCVPLQADLDVVGGAYRALLAERNALAQENAGLKTKLHNSAVDLRLLGERCDEWANAVRDAFVCDGDAPVEPGDVDRLVRAMRIERNAFQTALTRIADLARGDGREG